MLVCIVVLLFLCEFVCSEVGLVWDGDLCVVLCELWVYWCFVLLLVLGMVIVGMVDVVVMIWVVFVLMCDFY